MFYLQNIDKAFRDREDAIQVAHNVCWKLAHGAKPALRGENGAKKNHHHEHLCWAQFGG